MLGNLTLLAQQMDFSQDMPSDAAMGGAIAALGIFLVFIVLAVLAIWLVILFLLFSCFKRIPAQHRQMEPWQVWLLLIPLFNIVWVFFVFPKLGKSYQGYFAEQGRTDVGDCGEKIGLWYAICVAANIVLSWVPCLGGIIALASLVLLIMFLVKVLTLKGQIPVGTA